MPSATARDFQPIAQLLGFALTRTKEVTSVESSSRAVTIPMHAGHEIGPLLFLR